MNRPALCTTAFPARPDWSGDPPVRACSDGTVPLSAAPDRNVVAAALGALPAEYRSVIVETFYHGRSVPDTADVLGISADTVKTRCYDALRALKHALAEHRFTA